MQGRKVKGWKDEGKRKGGREEVSKERRKTKCGE